MEYPEGFPAHLRAPVDAAIAQAEIDLSALKKKLGRRFENLWQGFLLIWARTIFFAFTRQACQAGREGLWNVERIRIETEKYLASLANAAYVRIVPLKYRNSPLDISLDEIARSIKDSDEWSEFQSSLKGIAEGHVNSGVIEPGATVKPSNITVALAERMDRAAALLHISHDTMALRIKISRTTYFAVKAGRGRTTSRMKIEEFINEAIRKHSN